MLPIEYIAVATVLGSLAQRNKAMFPISSIRDKEKDYQTVRLEF